MCDGSLMTKSIVMVTIPNDPLIRDDHQGGVCRTVSRKIPNDLLGPDNLLIRDDRQGGASHAVTRKVPNNHWVPMTH